MLDLRAQRDTSVDSDIDPSEIEMRNRLHQFVLLALAIVIAEGQSSAQVNSDKPPIEIQGVNEIDKHYDAQIPLDTRFVDDAGDRVELGKYFGEKPVVISLNYSNCPMLCDLQLREFVIACGQLQMQPGVDYEVVSISIDPRETVDRAKATKEKYVALSGRTDTAKGWHMLTGDKASIDRIARTLGITYKYLPDRNEYSHPAAFVVCTPSGKISQYLQGTSLPVDTLRLSLVDASEGKLGSPLDWFVLTCFVYNADSNSYAPVAVKVMRWAGAFTVFVMLVCLVPFWFRRPKERDNQTGEMTASADQPPVVNNKE